MKKKQSHKNVQRRVLNYTPPLHKKQVRRHLDTRAFSKNVLFFCVIAACVGGIWYVIFGIPRSESSTTQPTLTVATSTLETLSSTKPVCNFKRVLDGECVENQDSVNAPVIAVMVENSLDAQPLSGVSKASVVYEAPAEGNIPRFLTIFPLDAQVEKLGPVRSSRPYYIDFMSE